MSKLEWCRQPVYIDINGNCYQVDSIQYDYDGRWIGREESPICNFRNITATIKAHPVDKKPCSFAIKKVIFNDPATIVLWEDGTKTVVKCHEGDIYDEQTGLLMCMAKKMYGNNGKFNDILREWLPKEEEECLSDYNASTINAIKSVVNALALPFEWFEGGKND